MSRISAGYQRISAGYQGYHPDIKDISRVSEDISRISKPLVHRISGVITPWAIPTHLFLLVYICNWQCAPAVAIRAERRICRQPRTSDSRRQRAPLEVRQFAAHTRDGSLPRARPLWLIVHYRYAIRPFNGNICTLRKTFFRGGFHSWW